MLNRKKKCHPLNVFEYLSKKFIIDWVTAKISGVQVCMHMDIIRTKDEGSQSKSLLVFGINYRQIDHDPIEIF